MRFLAVGFCCLIVSTTVVSAQDAATLAKSAQAVLKERCFSCHGESGANEGGFNYALNRKRLVHKLVVPGSIDESELYQRVIRVGAGSMPDGGPPLPKTEIETLKKWIESDAPAFGAEVKRPFVSPVDMLAVMLKDLEQANDRDRPFYRYFTLTHLYNAGFEDNELESHRQGLSKLVNSLSWGREVRVPQPIDPTKTILRIDLRHYKWNENEAWSRIVAADPYRVTYTHAAAQTCYLLTKSELPHARADWFVFAASRPPLYNLILGLPDKPDEMLKFEKERLGVDVARNLQDYNGVLRAGFFPSGVSKSIRLIERHGSSYGAYWKSYDFKPVDPKEQPPKRRNLKANPTGPGGPLGFEHDGGEMIFNLPNGLQAYMLTDAAGQQIAKGPTDVVVDKEAVKRGRDPEVVNGVSCMNCHWSGMLNKTDQIREHVLSQPAAYSKEVIEFVTAVYAPKADLNAKLTEDRQRFEAAVRQCGLIGLAKSEPVATLAFQFDEPLDLDLAAAEAGVTPDKLVAALRSNSVLGRELGSLPQGQPVPRDTFLQVFGAVVKELKVGTFLAALSIRPGSVNTTPTLPNTPSTAPPDPPLSPTAKAKQTIQGEWLCTAEEANGQTITNAGIQQRNRRIKISGTSLTMQRTMEKYGTYVGTFEIDAATGQFNWSGKGPAGQPVQWLGIYQLDGDTLKLCYRYNPDGKAVRPTAFKTYAATNSNVALTFKRIVTAEANAQEDGAKAAISLFDGKTLKGWHGNSAHWSVKDGAIVGRIIAPTPGGSFLISDKMYGDFNLRLKFRLVEGNSGVQIRSVEQPKYVVSGPQADIRFSDNFKGLGCLTGERFQPAIIATTTEETKTRLRQAVYPAGWNEMTVSATGQTVVITINEQVTVNVNVDKLPKTGVIALQLHGGGRTTVEFKDIQIDAPK